MALLLFSMGAIGPLPLGSIGSAPAATVAAMGAADLTAAAAAGMVISASTVLADLLYGGACWACGGRFVTAGERHEPAEVIPMPVRRSEPEPELDLAA